MHVLGVTMLQPNRLREALNADTPRSPLKGACRVPVAQPVEPFNATP